VILRRRRRRRRRRCRALGCCGYRCRGRARAREAAAKRLLPSCNLFPLLAATAAMAATEAAAVVAEATRPSRSRGSSLRRYRTGCRCRSAPSHPFPPSLPSLCQLTTLEPTDTRAVLLLSHLWAAATLSAGCVGVSSPAGKLPAGPCHRIRPRPGHCRAARWRPEPRPCRLLPPGSA
jgi:hypothetical protein